MNIAPEDFQARLVHVGGLNRYDEPNFVLWWGQYAYGPGSFRAGGVWSVDEQYFKGYRDLLRGSGEPCFCLGQWHAPEEYGSPEAYYIANLDETTNLQMLGEFPYSGRTELLYNLRWTDVIGGKVEFHTMPLNNTVFTVVAQIIDLARDISIERTRAAYLAAREAEESAKTADVERHLRDRAIPFAGSAVSFTRQGIRSTVIDKKMQAMQQRWSQLSKSASTFRPGLQTR